MGEPQIPRAELTDEEKDLIVMPDNAIQAKCSEMSFDTDRMAERVDGDDWQMVIQAHLYFDHVLTLMLREGLANPDALALDRVSFSQKLDLLAALDFVHPDVVVVIRAINSLRNKIAHKVDFIFDQEAIDQIFRRLPGWLEEYIREDPLYGNGLTFRKTLILTLLVLDVSRQRTNAGRLIEKKMRLRLRVTANHIRAGLRAPTWPAD